MQGSHIRCVAGQAVPVRRASSTTPARRSAEDSRSFRPAFSSGVIRPCVRNGVTSREAAASTPSIVSRTAPGRTSTNSIPSSRRRMPSSSPRRSSWATGPRQDVVDMAQAPETEHSTADAAGGGPDGREPGDLRPAQPAGDGGGGSQWLGCHCRSRRLPRKPACWSMPARRTSSQSFAKSAEPLVVILHGVLAFPQYEKADGRLEQVLPGSLRQPGSRHGLDPTGHLPRARRDLERQAERHLGRGNWDCLGRGPDQRRGHHPAGCS